MIEEPESAIRPGRDNDPDRVAAMRLRADRPRVTRLSRKVLAGGAAVGMIAISGAILWALQNNRSHSTAPAELYTTEHHNIADGLTGLPRDYAGIPRQVPPLGPALPGDLGRPMMSAQNAPSATLPGADPEQQRLGQEIEAARLSRLFASTNIRELAQPVAQSSPVDTSSEFKPRARTQKLTRCLRKTVKTGNSPSSTPPSTVGQQAPIASLHQLLHMLYRQATSFRLPYSPVSVRTCRARLLLR